MERQNKIIHISQLLPEQLQVPVPFEIVELTKEEKAEAVEIAIKQAMVKKHNSLETDRKKRLAEERMKDYRRDWTPNELYSLAKWRATQMIRYRTGRPDIEFEPTEFQQPIITALSLYFSNSQEFERLEKKIYNTVKADFSLQKGIWLWGNPGVGKSLMMEMFNRNKKMCYEMIQVPKLCYGYIKLGDSVFERMINITSVECPDAENFFQKQKGFCYNDVGTENLSANHYGNPVNVMQHILLQSYERAVPYWHRHVTTNLTFDQVKEAYGVRVLDRIKECFNILEVKGESLRR